MADARDLKSLVPLGTCGFESRLGQFEKYPTFRARDYFAFSRNTLTECAGNSCTKLVPAFSMFDFCGAILVGFSTVFTSSGCPESTSIAAPGATLVIPS